MLFSFSLMCCCSTIFEWIFFPSFFIMMMMMTMINTSSWLWRVTNDDVFSIFFLFHQHHQPLSFSFVSSSLADCNWKKERKEKTRSIFFLLFMLGCIMVLPNDLPDSLHLHRLEKDKRQDARCQNALKDEYYCCSLFYTLPILFLWWCDTLCNVVVRLVDVWWNGGRVR